jgi:methionyl-tRNA synthetase
MSQRKILVTYALPYANGAIHLGHLVGYLQTDIWVRFQKMRGHQCYYICASDEHGTPVMVKALQQGIAPEIMTEQFSQEQQRDFADFDIHFEQFHRTHSKENQELAETIYHRLHDRGNIIKRHIEQAFDPEKNIFLPDRYVKGTCPKCHTNDQYGDNCESCSAAYSPLELVNPKSILSGATPIAKQSEHLFFALPNYTDILKAWTRAGHLQSEVTNKLNEWFESGLKEWDISRDAPYYGFEIPGEPGKYFYVWLDAPIGYIASFKKFCDTHPDINFDEFWNPNSSTELYHFIGKDIIYFHALFWPAMLHGAQYRKPTAIYAHGFLTVNGKKMSKSRGTFIRARTYLDHLNPQFLRYYYAAKLNSHVEDIDLNIDDFVARNNADLIGKIINIASRCSRFINKNYENKLAKNFHDHENALLTDFVSCSEEIATAYEDREYSKAIRLITSLADTANQYVDQQKPWVLIKDPQNATSVHAICTLGLNCFRLIILYLKPVLPQLARDVETLLKIPPLTWADVSTPLLDHDIATFTPLLQRIDKINVENMLLHAKDDLTEQ